MNGRLTAAIAATLCLMPAAALAQDEPKRDLVVTVGAGAQAYPRYPGADRLRLAPMPIFDFRKDGDPLTFEAADEGIGFGFLGKKSAFDFGPAVQFQTKRKERDVGAAVGNVPFTVEAGGFVQAYAGRNLRFRAEARRGIGGHDAWLGDVSADFIFSDRARMRTLFSIGPRLRLSDGRYNRAYFGVTPAAAARTGLAAYRPSGGVRAVGVVAGLVHQLSYHWGINAYAGYDRLVGDSADSPIVRRFGRRGQPSAGLGLSYTFKVKRGSR
jgi:outer membrane scaffolding protein for murein synthesis (MipA/OmpV family)